jgi:hypothetical protein
MEIPREFYNKHRHELAQFISAEVCDDIAYLTFVRGPKQVVVQFDLKKFLSANERKSEAQYMCAWPWVNEIVGPSPFRRADYLYVASDVTFTGEISQRNIMGAISWQLVLYLSITKAWTLDIHAAG